MSDLQIARLCRRYGVSETVGALSRGTGLWGRPWPLEDTAWTPWGRNTGSTF